MTTRGFDESRSRQLTIPTFNPYPETLAEEIGYIADTYMSMDSNSAYVPRIIRGMMSRRLISLHSQEMIISYQGIPDTSGDMILLEMTQAFANREQLVVAQTVDEHTLAICTGTTVQATVSLWTGNCAENTIKVIVTGERQLTERLVKHYRESSVNILPSITRYFATRHGLSESVVTFSPPKLDIDSSIMYPQLERTPEEMVEGFANSRDNVLLLLGAPGTGKSNYVKRMLLSGFYPRRAKVHIVDSIAAIEDDSLVSRIYTLPSGSVVIFEDIDDMLRPRNGGNSMMSSLLNAAEGIASPDVKFIITTNLRSLTEMDSAIYRPGRCYDHVEFGLLSPEQQTGVLTAMGYPDDAVPDYTRTLADVMARRNLSHVKRSFGFVS